MISGKQVFLAGYQGYVAGSLSGLREPEPTLRAELEQYLESYRY